MPSQSCRAGGTLILSESAFQFAGRIFGGWTTRAGGAVEYRPGDSVTVSSAMTFYAVWELPPFEFGGDAEWTFLGGGVWQSGSIGDNRQTWIQKTVSGTGRVSFDWSSSSEVNRDELQFFIDGKRRAWISGESGWTTKSFDLTGSGTHVLKWVYAKDGTGRSGSDCGWIRNFVWTGASGGATPSAGVGGSTFNGYALDGDGVVSGTFVLAVKKPKKGASTAAATLTFVSLATGKKTKINGNVTLATGEGSGALAGLKVGTKTVAGSVAKVGTLTGGVDAVKAKDSAALAVLAKFNGKSYIVALAPDQPEGYTQGGYSTLAITLAAKGKVKVAGVLADGTKVTATAQMTVGDTDCSVPVIYAKKSKFGFVARFDKNTRGLVEVTALTTWKNTAKPAFTMAWGVIGNGAKGTLAGGVRTVSLDDAKLSGFVPNAIEQTPKEIPVTVKGTKWDAGKAAKVAYKGGALTIAGTNVSALKLTYTAKTGLFKGNFTVYAVKGGKLVKNKFNVFGAVTDGIGYGTAVLKGKGSVAVTVE
ncbi:MAG: InlB B-repeat-containing protein [Kiritimatiellae bacterium]|nr:InlB B-repeat-containing protein [Kiritimatiellia bacterium]